MELSKSPHYCLDTCIISEFAKKEPNINILKQFEELHSFCAISVITLQELLFGIQTLPDGAKKNSLSDFVHNVVRRELPIIDYTSLAATIYADILSRCKNIGIIRPYSDTQIASIAIANNMILVTKNIKDFLPFTKISSLYVENWA